MNKPTYKDSNGNRYSTEQINRKSDLAAKQMLLEQQFYYGYNFCEECKRNDCKPIDVAHAYSRKKAKEDGCVEVLWDKTFMKILGRECHKKYDNLNLQFK